MHQLRHVAQLFAVGCYCCSCCRLLFGIAYQWQYHYQRLAVGAMLQVLLATAKTTAITIGDYSYTEIIRICVCVCYAITVAS